MPPKLPPQALETAHEKLKAFRSRGSKAEWKAFEIVNANEDLMQGFASPHKFETQLIHFMEKRVRLPCIICQGHQGMIYCSITYTSKLSQKERISQNRFRPTVYFVFFPNENIFYSTRLQIPDVIDDAVTEMFGATRLRKLPLEGKDFWSLRQLHFNKAHKGMLCRRPVPDTHPIDFDVDMAEDGPADTDDVIQDEDEGWKKSKNQYYHKHFFPEKDPKITKFTISSTSKFAGTRATRQLNCDLKVTFRTENLIKFFDYSMDKGILSYPLNPFLENVVNLGRTSISINSQEP